MQEYSVYNKTLNTLSAIKMIPVTNKTGILILFVYLLTISNPCNIYSEDHNKLNAFYHSLPEIYLTEDEENVAEQESVRRMPVPEKAAMLSAAFPGFGQIYNRKYWKVPIIYAGFGVIAYFLDMNSSNYNKYRKAYFYRLDGNPMTVDDFPNYSTDVLRRAMNYYRRNLEITYILAGALYILNILDASVDAHLMDFDVSEDLSFRLEPVIEKINYMAQPSAGIKLIIKF